MHVLQAVKVVKRTPADKVSPAGRFPREVVTVTVTMVVTVAVCCAGRRDGPRVAGAGLLRSGGSVSAGH